MTNTMKWIILIIATALMQIEVIRVKGYWISRRQCGISVSNGYVALVCAKQN